MRVVQYLFLAAGVALAFPSGAEEGTSEQQGSGAVTEKPQEPGSGHGGQVLEGKGTSEPGQHGQGGKAPPQESMSGGVHEHPEEPTSGAGHGHPEASTSGGEHPYRAASPDLFPMRPAQEPHSESEIKAKQSAIESYRPTTEPSPAHTYYLRSKPNGSHQWYRHQSEGTGKAGREFAETPPVNWPNPKRRIRNGFNMLKYPAYSRMTQKSQWVDAFEREKEKLETLKFDERGHRIRL